MNALDATTNRLHYIDWLRVLAVLLLFPYHTLRVFNTEAFYVKAGQLSTTLDYVLGFISVWHMQLLFVLAGASTYFALRKRSSRQYLGERFTRLGVPFVMGVFLVLIPVQTWYGARFNSGYQDSFWHYLISGDFLQWNIQDGRRLLRRLRLRPPVVPLRAAPRRRDRAAAAREPRARRRAAAGPLAPPRPPRLVAGRGAADHARRGRAGPDRRARALLLPRVLRPRLRRRLRARAS